MTKKKQYTDEEVTQAVASSSSIAQALRKIGLRPAGGNYTTLKQNITRLGLSTEHFRGQGWNKGRTYTSGYAVPLTEVLVKGRYTNTGWLRKRLIREGVLAAQCADCKLSSWKNQPIPLELDHINGDNTDNSVSNLRVLCPNCHALTDTYRGRNMLHKRTPA